MTWSTVTQALVPQYIYANRGTIQYFMIDLYFHLQTQSKIHHLQFLEY